MGTNHDQSEDAMSRRMFLQTTVGVGYALAVSPVTAMAFSTPLDGLEVKDISIRSGAESLPAYVARPKGKGNGAAVIVVQEIFGIHEYIKDVCRRLAKEGYLAVAPSLYFRQGDATKIEDIKKLMAEIVSKVDQRQVMSDLDATVHWIEQETAKGHQKTARIGITGFCWGGGVTWVYASQQPKVKAGVAWYGKITGDKTSMQSLFPLDVAGGLKAPVLGLYGEKDHGIPLEHVEKMKASLKAANSKSRIEVFAGAEHGFHADYRPSYNEKAAKEGWRLMLEWFKKNHVG
jgi:carboxymethylenebutenolidase